MVNESINKKWPIYFKDRLIISNPSSNIAIVTLWTPKETVQKLVDSAKYLIMGQLYTKKGINFLLRNILAKPQISKIYIVGNDLMESGSALIKFVADGIDNEYHIIGDGSGKIEKEISLDAIESFRKNVEVIDLRGAENLKKLVDELEKVSNDDLNVKEWRKPEIFSDPPKPQISTYPSEIDLIKIRGATISGIYPSVVKHVMQFGLESEPSIGNASSDSNKMKELLNLSVVIKDESPDDWFIPEYMPFSNDDLESYFKGFFNPDKGTEDYTYGERLFNYAANEIEQMKEIYPWLKIDRFQKFFPNGGIDQVAVAIIRKLQGFQYDKGAIALLGNPFSDVFPQRPPKKIPCLFLIQGQIYQNQFNLTAYFRSNDMYSAWPLNAFALRKLQSEIAEKLDVELGSLITISNMAHIYEHDYSAAEELIKKHYKPECEWDPRGNFHILVENNDIVVRLMTPRGNEELKEWRIDGKKRKAAHDLCYKIIERDLAVSVLGNAADLARQLERAEIAVKLGIKFDQDNTLDLSNVIPSN